MKNPRTLRALTGVLTLLLLALCPRLWAYDLTVDRLQPVSATNFQTVQAAINAAPTGRTTPYTIFIKNGRYKESILVPSNKPFIQLVGESVANTILTYNNSAGTIATSANNPNTLVVNGTVFGTQGSASVSINAADFSAMNITFENSFGEAASGGQAVAILVNNDRAAFRNCRFLGNQDTMYLKGSGNPRAYFVNCYIEGNTDFIFGNTTALFETCNIYAKIKAGIATSYILAPSTAAGQAYGFVFKSCNVTGNPVTNGTNTKYDLARPWQGNPKAAFLNCNLSTPLILAEGWAPTSSAGSATIADSYFVEYQNTHFRGTPITTSSRVVSGSTLGQTSSQLTAAEAANYTTANILGSWNPCAVIDCVTPFVKSVVVNNFKGTKGATTSTLTWNTSWPISGDVLSIYRSTTTPPAATGVYSVVGSQTEPNDTTFNYTYTDTNPASGNIYKYYVKGSVTPQQTSSDTVTISSAPTIVATSAMGSFTQLVGSPSPNQSFTVSGTDLQGNVLVTAPTNYQVSATSGGTYTSSITLTQAGGTLASTPVFVRLNAAGAGSYAGNVALTSTNATTTNVAVSGSAIVAPTVFSAVLAQWPLTRNILGTSTGTVAGYPTLQAPSADSAFARNARVLAGTPTFKRMYLSNGTTMATIRAYSTQFGQAMGPTSNGDGTFTSPTGPGGTLGRRFYEQFTVTAAAGSTVRIDSLLYNAAFYNSSSGPLMGIVYSKNGFAAPADSTEITGGTGPAGTLALATSGTFSKAFALTNQTGGPTALYRVALSGPTAGNPSGGVTLTAGQTLTIRLYFAIGSTGTPRYAMLKNFRVKGFADAAATPGDITVSGGQTLTGSYNNVTVPSGATATLMLPLTVNGTLTAASGGVVNTNGQTIVGAGNVVIGAGSELQIGDANGITASGATGSVRNTGTRSFSADATYTYNGLTPNGIGINQKGLGQSTGAGLPATVRGLTVNNGGSDNLATNPVTLTQPTAVTQLMRIQKGTLASGGNLTLLSVAGQGTAVVDNTGGSVTGTATMQRAIDVVTPTNDGYHQFSSPVSSALMTVLNTPVFTHTFNTAYNSAAIAGTVRPFPTVFGYDETRTSNTTLATDQDTFNKGFYVPAANATMSVGRGFTANMPNAAVVNFTGTLNNGSYTLGNSLTRGAGTTSPDDNKGWQMLGNPYPSPLDWSTMLTSQFNGVGTAVYVYQATSTYGGTYRSYVPNGTGTGGVGSSPLIDAGSAFWVRVTTPGATNATLSVFTGTNRSKTFAGQPAFGRAAAGASASTQPELRLILAGNGRADDAYLYFNDQATAATDAQFDAPKLANPSGLNVATLTTAGQQLAIDGRPTPTTATVLPLFISVPAAGSYTLTANTLANFGATTVYLRDALTGTRTLLAGGRSYAFTMNATTAPGRFALEFAPAGTALATAAQTLAAQVQLYPNPTQGRFHVVLPAGAKAASATLTNALGQVVLTRVVTGNEADFSLTTPGVYTLRLMVDGTAIARKVVVE